MTGIISRDSQAPKRARRALLSSVARFVFASILAFFVGGIVYADDVKTEESRDPAKVAVLGSAEESANATTNAVENVGRVKLPKSYKVHVERDGRRGPRLFPRAMKARKYEEQGGRCPACGGVFMFNEMEGDHIIPWSKGGETTEMNL